MSHTASTAAVKAIDGDRIGGYLIVWGDSAHPDLHGEYFTPETDLALDWYPRRPVLYQHGLDGAVGPALVGVIDTLRADTTGLWAEAQLAPRREGLGEALRALIARGILAWSSGSLPHLVEVAADGRILRWPIVEGSLTPTPAEPRRTSVRAIKDAYAALGLSLERLTPGGASPDPRADLTLTRKEHPPVNREMKTHEDILAAVNAALDERAALNERAAQDDPPAERRALKRLPTGDPVEAAKALAAIEVGSPYDGLSALDMAHGYVMLRAVKGFRGVSERYANALAYKVRRAGLSAIKADELSYSTQSGYGDEWVPDLWSAELWRQARLDNVILPLLRAVEMPSNPYELPIEGADPTVYYVPETTDEAELVLGSGNPIPDSKIGSAKVTLAAKKLALRVGFSAELAEDSLVPVLSMYREQAMRALAAAIDSVILNGDTTTAATGNINSDNAAPPAGATYLAFDGLRKLPLVTTTANAISAGGDPTLALLRQARFSMAHRYSVNPRHLAWIVDGGTYAKLLGLSEFLTMDKAGPGATALTGQIGFVDGIPVLVSAEMPLTMADGKVDTTGNSKGQALCVYRPGWIVGYRRRIAASVDYLPYYDAYQMTATVRLGLARLDNDVAAVLYNITV
ncbi:MAG: phage major capsid protein [Anaerolineae bacterium]|nr:phage major capsid protein [Anaerolineae bacterium]